MNEISDKEEVIFSNEPWKMVLDFWFNPKNKPYWFKKDEAFDNEIYDKFYDIWQSGCQGLLSDWRVSLYGRLAEIIVLDQFSRNLCRQKACAFTQDGMALVLSQEAIRQPGFTEMLEEEKKFMIMPFMHSESSGIHEQAVVLFEELSDKETAEYEYRHKEIIDRFGRYPHRNKALNRESTPEEIEFLKQPGSSF
ncbi:hypothetical protein DUF924 [Gottschalkia acidurici 9a]|uniref:Transmembrane protein n=1 Tax=Gottschalkia acidurici (strain ATCC 7906 / DSM 604 / BCRC 14475 / CIP 104303 / KCTC 5404 / NCIMB 10678 / 9a) TaxID=1128398 RepID=K0B2S0_GOTA9|nr:DUF924 family protein [Gottschalkia acidurici]AFS79789.1 hypothetical protein DUF924 [Gottschalkia acidurici 9a]